ncbi:protein FAM76A isoform X2 [Adelges cooleyi]|uniref:protein FAM76A isoform X2 n=1 Tax=Adelges cooleyi TaxID=133065 RepID=UPI00218017BF|nr:protein FAM76A isoform X2 [Adelges cooleyi]
MSNNKSALFACSKCFKRHPYEELSSGQQLCKECRGSYPVVKCTYCRSEFQQTDKSNTSTICKKCEQFVVQYGRPTACNYCNIIAAFIGQKCQRCANSERKYGPPVTCDQCKQNCAFNRQDVEIELLEGKVLCWLCTLSFKRALAKTKKSDAEMKQLSRKRDGKNKHSNVMKLIDDSGPDFALPPPSKMHKNFHKHHIDSNSSDHVVVITELREQIAMIQKLSNQKDFQLLNKDKLICELKAKHFTTENELRNKMNSDKKEYSREVEMLHSKIKTLQKEVATLSKSGGKRGAHLRKEHNDSGSGTDSPSVT